MFRIRNVKRYFPAPERSDSIPQKRCFTDLEILGNLAGTDYIPDQSQGAPGVRSAFSVAGNSRNGKYTNPAPGELRLRKGEIPLGSPEVAKLEVALWANGGKDPLSALK